MQEDKFQDCDTETPLQREALDAVRRFGFYGSDATACGGSDRAYLVNATSAKGKHVKLFLKHSEHEPLWELAVQQEMKRSGFKFLANYFPCNEGGFSSLLYSNRYWTCQEFFDKTIAYDWLKFNCRPRHCHIAGAVLAKLHKAGENAVSSLNIERETGKHIFTVFPAKFRQTADRVRLLLNAASSLPATKTGRDKKAAGLALLRDLNLPLLQERAAELAEQVTKLENRQRPTVNHGDYHPSNLLITKQVGLSAVVDWEYAAVGSCMWDLAHALFIFSLNGPITSKSQGTTFSLGRSECVLYGYNLQIEDMTHVRQLGVYSDFLHMVLLKWVCDELCNADSRYREHNGFLYMARVLASLTRVD